MYYRLSKNFCKKYTNVTESMNIVHDYQAVPFIDREKLTKIGERFCIFESIFLNVLFCLVKELNNVISTSDNRERRKRIDDIFDGVINVDLTRLEDVEEDELNSGKSKKGAAIQIPSMEDLILNVLQKADYFD